MLETLLTAVESESQFIDIARVSGFMQKVRLPLCTFIIPHAKTERRSGSQWCDIVTVDGRAVYHCIGFLIPMHVQSVLVSLFIFSLAQDSHTPIVYYITHPDGSSWSSTHLYRLSFFVDGIPWYTKPLFVRYWPHEQWTLSLSKT